MTRRTTKPASRSRFSALHNAHSPVRGHGEERAVGALPAAMVVEDVTPVAVAVDDADTPLSEADGVHPNEAAEAAATKPKNFIIGTKDRGGAEAPRLLFIGWSIGGVTCQQSNEYDRAPPRRWRLLRWEPAPATSLGTFSAACWAAARSRDSLAARFEASTRGPSRLRFSSPMVRRYPSTMTIRRRSSTRIRTIRRLLSRAEIE